MNYSERLSSANGLFSYFVIYVTAIKYERKQNNCSTMVFLRVLLKVVDKAESGHVKRV